MTSTASEREWELLRGIDPLGERRSAALLEPNHRSDLLSEIVGTGRNARHLSVRHRPGSPPRRLWATIGVSGTALTGGVVAAVLLLSSTAPPAFAGWTPVPTPATPAALATATSTCNSQWDQSSPSVLSVSQVVLSETRDNYTAALYLTNNGVYDCITDGDAHGTGVGRAATTAPTSTPGSDQITVPIGSGGAAPGFPGGNPNQPLPQRWQQALSHMTNSAQRARQEQIWRNALAHGVESNDYGQAGKDVSAITFSFTDGLTVDATVQNGWYFAWWPTLDIPTTVAVTTPTGTITSSLSSQCDPATAGCVFSTQTG